MKNSKLLLLLKSLDVAEFKKLRKFLSSAYYNHDRHVVDLYDCLAKYYPSFDAVQLEKEVVFQRLFPDQPFDGNKLRKGMSALTGLVEEYLSLLEFERDAYQKKTYRASAYDKRNLTGFFKKEIGELMADLNAASDFGRTHYYKQLELNSNLFYHSGTDKKKDGQALLDKAMDNLDAFYLLTKLQFAAEMRTRENILAEKYTIRLLEETIRESKHAIANQNPLSQVYLHIIDLHQDSSSAALLAAAIALFRTLHLHINHQEQQTILHHLLNHCIRLANRGETQYQQELFELYQLGIEGNLLIENNQITEITFSNIVATGASLKAFEWTLGFIDDYAVFLKEMVRQDTKALSLALVYFNQKSYEQAERSLLGQKFSDMLNLLKSRCLLIRIWFEQFVLGETNFLFLMDQLDAFEKFIRRQKKIAKGKSTAYLNFVKWTKKLAQKKYDRERTADLRKQIEALAVVYYKGWLMEKTEEP